MAAAAAEVACGAVAAFDAAHPGVRTSGDAEDDDQALDFLRRMTGR